MKTDFEIVDTAMLVKAKDHRRLTNALAWIKRHGEGVSGALCISVSLVLMGGLLCAPSDIKAASDTKYTAFVTLIIAVYAMVRGILALAFDKKCNDMGLSVYRHICVETYNQLLFVYEKMLWLWGMTPILLAILPLIAGRCGLEVTHGLRILYFTATTGYIIILLVYSKPLVIKRKRLKNKLSTLESDLDKTTASS